MGQRTPLAFITSKLQMSVWHGAFKRDVDIAANALERIDEENGVVVDTDAGRLVTKCGDGGEDVGLCGGGIGFIF